MGPCSLGVFKNWASNHTLTIWPRAGNLDRVASGDLFYIRLLGSSTISSIKYYQLADDGIYFLVFLIFS